MKVVPEGRKQDFSHFPFLQGVPKKVYNNNNNNNNSNNDNDYKN